MKLSRCFMSDGPDYCGECLQCERYELMQVAWFAAKDNEEVSFDQWFDEFVNRKGTDQEKKDA